MSAKGQKQTALQRKIFTRWINQKLVPAKLEPISDCVEDFADGYRLALLLQVLSEKEFAGGKRFGPQTMRMKQIEQGSRVLKFCFEDCGVVLKLKPSAENLADKDERNILSLVWGIMLRFLKFGDEDDQQLSAEEALLMWVRNQVSAKGIEIKSFKKSFADGLALAAIMNKFRPKILDYDSVATTGTEAVLTKTFASAEKCFGLEQYLSVEDYSILDEKSMLIYVSDYYMGAAEMRKIDLACRRVIKLVNYTKINDQLRADFTATAGPLRERVDDALKRLEDHVIDNTMAGAKKNCEEFATYKSQEKGKNISDFLKVENSYLNLAMRLADHERPAFAPGNQLLPADFAVTMAAIEAAEKKKATALAAELNRQIHLANVYSQHQAISAKLQAWTEDKLSYLNTKEVCDASGVAKYHLNRLKAYRSECESTKAQTWETLKKQGAELEAEKFEHSEAVQSAEASINRNLEAMDAQAITKEDILQDDLARNLYIEKINAVAEQGLNRFNTLKTWIEAQLAYTAKKEEITCVADAQLQLSLLAAYESNKKDLSETTVPAIKALNAEVLSSEYTTDLSQWEHPGKDGIRESEKYIDDSWATLDSQSATKKAILEDDLAREKFKEEIRLCNLEHVDRHSHVKNWIEQKNAYLDVREEIDTIEKANTALDVLSSYNKDNTDMSNTSVLSLTTLGERIITAEYKTDLSQWVSPDIPSVQERESFVTEQWDVLKGKAEAKKTFLDAELARELKKEELRLKIAEQGGDFMLWSTMTLDTVKAAHFGFLLEDIEAYASVLSSSEESTKADGKAKLDAYNATFEEAKSIGVVDNRYTTLSPSDLTASLATLEEAVAKRHADYDAELATARANDALDKEFSTLVDGLGAKVEGYRNQISSSSAELKEQEAFVAERLADTAESSQLPKVAELNDKINEAGFAVRHTTLSKLDIDIAWENYQTFLKAKSEALAGQILHQQLRGVSEEEYKEIESQFKQFDANGNGTLDLTEFKACLYSLGEEKTKKDVLAVIAKFGDGTLIPYDGFKEFMIEQLGDTDTKEEIVEGFRLMNKGLEVAKEEIMMELLADEIVEWIKGEAPKVGDDYDYIAFSEQVFAR